MLSASSRLALSPDASDAKPAECAEGRVRSVPKIISKKTMFVLDIYEGTTPMRNTSEMQRARASVEPFQHPILEVTSNPHVRTNAILYT